ncbi:MAG: hypothetical protein PT977_11765, partial [Acidobacteriota bacterium]|nr:hypothetical protein [Acidobacteriota bacterium]
MTGLATVAVAQSPFDNTGTGYAAGYTPGRSVFNSYHNLGVNGPNDALKSAAVAAGGTTEVCVYCHTPHNATKPRILWNKQDYQAGVWANITVDFGNKGDGSAAPGTSDAGTPWTAVTVQRFSARCLVCHDGSTSVGQ